MDFLWQALRQVAFLLDEVAYGLIPSAFELIFYLANLDLSTNEIIVGIINRIYLILGIFMLFKVSFSIMQYLVDPNAFSDKSKGFGKLVTNSLVSVVLLAMIPWLFDFAYDLQSKIILSNVIPNLILGEHLDDYSSGTPDEKNIKDRQREIHSVAVDTQFTIFSAFYTLNTNQTGGYPACDPNTTNKPLSNVIGSSDMVNECWGEVSSDLESEIHNHGGTLKGLFKYEGTGDNCVNGICDERDFGTFKYLLWWMKDGNGKGFTINYIPIISAVVGVYLLLLLITFAIDIATRLFRLLFLQAIAPIAIISYIDPKESASNGKLHNWTVEVGKVYASLFLRLAVIYLAIELIKLLTSVVFAAFTNGSSLYYNGVAPEGAMNIFLYIILILGIFTFAKKLPEMIERIFNIKLSGELHLNPFKNQAFAGAAAVGLAGAGAMAANALAAPKRLSSMRNKWLEGGGFAGAKRRLGDSFNNAVNKFGDYEPFGHNEGVNARKEELKIARKRMADLRYEHIGGRITDDEYKRRKETIQRTIQNKKSEINQEQAQRAKDRKEDWNTLKKSAGDVVRETANMARPVTESASTIAGIAAAGAAAGARAAIPGSKATSPSGVRDAARSAREASNAAREERNSRADMAREGRYSSMDRARDTINKFSGTKGDKSYGVGQISDEINDLKNKIVNIERARQRSNEMVAEAYSKNAGISDSTLKDMLSSLMTANSKDAKNIITSINTHMASSGTSIAEQNIANDFIAAINNAQSLTEQQVGLQKQLKQLEDVTNLNNPKSDK